MKVLSPVFGVRTLAIREHIVHHHLDDGQSIRREQDGLLFFQHAPCLVKRFYASKRFERMISAETAASVL
ncbi:MAG: hypothetical protein ACYDER_00280 [Ktedonobacteraceae bacterium]